MAGGLVKFPQPFAVLPVLVPAELRGELLVPVPCGLVHPDEEGEAGTAEGSGAKLLFPWVVACPQLAPPCPELGLLQLPAEEATEPQLLVADIPPQLLIVEGAPAGLSMVLLWAVQPDCGATGAWGCPPKVGTGLGELTLAPSGGCASPLLFTPEDPNEGGTTEEKEVGARGLPLPNDRLVARPNVGLTVARLLFPPKVEDD